MDEEVAIEDHFKVVYDKLTDYLRQHHPNGTEWDEIIDARERLLTIRYLMLGY